MRYLLIIIFIGTLALITGCMSGNSAANESITPGLQEGKVLFEAYCTGCHGKSGNLGLNGALPLSASRLSDEDARNLILKGKNVMVGFEGILSKEDIDKIVAYIKIFRTQEN